MTLDSANIVPAQTLAAPIWHSRTENGQLSEMPYLLYYWQLVMRFWWIIGGIILSLLALGLVVTLLIPPQYTAHARIEIDREQKSMADVSNLDSGPSHQDTEFYQTQYALLATRALADRVVSSLDLGNNSAFFLAHGVGAPITEQGVGLAERKVRERQAANLLLAHIAIDPVKDSKLVDIRYTSRSAELSAKIANEWVRSFIETRIDQQYSSTGDARHFLEGRLNEMRERLQRSERAASDFASGAGIVKLAQAVDSTGHTVSSQTLVEMALTARAAALNQATQSRITAQTQLSPDAGDASLDSSIIGLRQARSQLAAQYAQMLVQHEPTYPAAQELAAQMRQIDTDIRSAAKRIHDNRQMALKQAKAQEAQLESEVAELRRQLNEQQQATIQYNILLREADTNRQLYDALLQRYKEIGIAGTVGVSQVTTVDAALQPNGPSSPSLLKNLAFALLLGLVLSGSAIFAIEHVGQSIHDSEMLARTLDIPIIGEAPLIPKTRMLTPLEDSASPLFEAYVSISSALSFATSHGVPKTLMVTSTRSGEGKSTTAAMLALILARKGKQVLLVDGDMRAPSLAELLSKHLSMIPEKGLSNYLSGEDDWTRNIQASDIAGLSLLSSGPKPPNAAELLTEQRLGALLAYATTVYDNVVIDTPPILGLADAPFISGMAEASLLVVEAGGPAQRAVKAATNRLRMTNGKLLGAVLTKVPRSHNDYSGIFDYYGQADDEQAG